MANRPLAQLAVLGAAQVGATGLGGQFGVGKAGVTDRLAQRARMHRHP